MVQSDANNNNLRDTILETVTRMDTKLTMMNAQAAQAKPTERPGILTSNFLTFFILAASATFLAYHGTITGEMWTGAVVVAGLGYMGFRTAQISKTNGNS